MKTEFEQLMTGLNEVETFLAGNQKGFKVHVPEAVDVKSIRNKLKMTQLTFSDTFGFSLDAIKHWEGGRRTPEAPARTLLMVIYKNPAAVIKALQPEPLAKTAAVGSSKITFTMSKTTPKKKYMAMAAKARGNHGARSHPKNT